MNRRSLWKISVATNPESEEAVLDSLQNLFGNSVSAYTNAETGKATVTVYLPKRPKRWNELRDSVRAALRLRIGSLPGSDSMSRQGPRIVRLSRTDAVTSPSPPTGGGEGRGEEETLSGLPLSPALSPLVPRGERGSERIGSGADQGWVRRISLQRIRREDWAESWKRHFKPIEIGSALLIKPSWSLRRPKKGEAVVVLDPGLSFGTGQHPTTSFCLKQLVAHRFGFSPRCRAVAAGRVSGFGVKKPPHALDSKLKTRNSKPSFMDIGTGSGILTIAAVKLGYSPVIAFDFDPEAVRIAKENARRNRAKIKIFCADITKLPQRSERKYDVICANLISNLLIEERRRILSRLKPDGVLVVAGILKREFSVLQKIYEGGGLKLVAAKTENEWRSGAFQRTKISSARLHYG